MFLLVIVGPVYCIFQLQMEFAQENVFCTEIYSDTQLMQKYRDISLKGGFLPHATLRKYSVYQSLRTTYGSFQLEHRLWTC